MSLHLFKTEIAAMKQLAGEGYLVGGTRGLLSERSYDRLRRAGYLDEVWTWASTTRPDVRLSADGAKALAQASQPQEQSA